MKYNVEVGRIVVQRFQDSVTSTKETFYRRGSRLGANRLPIFPAIANRPPIKLIFYFGSTSYKNEH